jgi:ABC-2 type transport system permease protein
VTFSPEQKIRLNKGLEALRTQQEKDASKPAATAVAPAVAAPVAPVTVAPVTVAAVPAPAAPAPNAAQPGTKAALAQLARRPVSGDQAAKSVTAPPTAVVTTPIATGAIAREAGARETGAQSTGPAPIVQGFRLDQLFERQDAVKAGRAPSAVTYYAGAVAMLFLLFSALSGAMSYLDERESGLLDRLAIGPGGVGVLIDGKFLFLCVQGFLQVAVIFLVGWAVFGIELWSNLLPWAATTLAAALAAAGLALAFVTLCRSKQQAQSLGQMLILVVSAIGGSMVPRYLMPGYIQTLGWATPNTWALDAYSSIFARADAVTALLVPWTVLVSVGLIGLIAAHLLARRALAAVA